MSRLTKYLHITRRFIWYSIAGFVIVIAVLVSLLRVFLPDVTSYRDDVEQLASAFLDHTVRIESMDARLVGFTPTVIFNDVHMLDKTGERELVRFKQARVGIALIESMRRQQVVPSDFVIDGIQLAITRRKDGRFLVQGVDIEQLGKTFQPEKTRAQARGTGEFANWLFGRTHIALQNSTVLWKDLKQGGNTLQFDDVSIEIKNNNKRHQLNGYVKLPKEMGKRFELAMDVTGDILNPRAMRGRIYMQGDAIQLDKWGVKPQYRGVTLHTGMADFQVWGKWQDNAIQQLSGDLTAYNLSLSLPIMDKPFHLNLMGGLFDVGQTEHGWQVNIDRFQYMSAGAVWPETRFRILHTRAGEQQPASWQVQTEYFRLEDVAGLLKQTNILDKQQHKMLDTLEPAGDIRWLHFRKGPNHKQQVNYQLQANFADLSTRPWQSVPGVSGLNGELWGNLNRGKLKLDSGPASLDFPRLFRWPIKLNKLQGNVQWSRKENNLRIWTDALTTVNDDAELVSSLLLDIPADKGVSPFMDLQSRFTNANVEFIERYYPTGIMKKQLVNWLDRSVVDGQVEKGGLVYNGRLKDFPFRNNQGQFKVEFDGEGVVLDYQKGWPRVTEANVSASFTGLGMDIIINSGKLFNTRISQSRATIPRFKTPVLHLAGDTNGSLKDVARFLVESPAAPGGRSFFERAAFDGTAHTRFAADIPLSKRVAKTMPVRYQGQVDIKKGGLLLLDKQLDITGIDGSIAFDQDGVSSTAIPAKLMGDPVEFEVSTQNVDQDRRRISILANGKLDMARAAKRFAMPGAQAITGKSSWHGAVVLHTGQSDHPPLIRVMSNLDEVQIDLPPPLAKSREDQARLVLQARFARDDRTSVSVNFANRLSALLELRQSRRGSKLQRGYVHLGPGHSQLPQQSVLLVTGALDSLRLSDWAVAHDDGKASASRQSLFALPVRVALDRLVVVRAEANDEQQATDKRDTASPPPRDFHGISGYINQLQYGNYPLGKAEFEITSLQKGLHLRRLALEGDNIRLNASGDWLYQRNQHQTKLNFELASPDMGKMLEGFGFSAIIAGGDMLARGDVEWEASPAWFDLPSLKGKMDLEVKKGSMRNVQAGAGRFLGLFSLSALPRRLMLDFRDTFQEGFSFDRMQGQMQFRQGNAYTDNLNIVSPVAEIRVKGRTGLVEEDFDQYVTVVPQVGDTLPVAGGLLFGTQVGAAILFFEKLLGSGIDEASAASYHITGSWEAPNIVALGKKRNSKQTPGQNAPEQVE